MKNPKAPRQKAKDLSATGKKCYKNADTSNRGTGSAAELPANWDENSVKARGSVK